MAVQYSPADDLSSTINAQKYTESAAADIIDRRPEIAERAGELYIVLGSSRRVYEALKGVLKLRDGISNSTAINIVRLLVNAEVPEDVRSRVQSSHRSQISRSIAPQVNAKKRENGRLVFTPEETDLLLLFHELYKARIVTYEQIAEIMRHRFDCDMFTAEKCKKRAHNVLTGRKKAEQGRAKVA